MAVTISVPRQQQCGGEWSAARSADRDTRVARHLARLTLAAQLHHRFMGKAKSVQATGANLAAERIERQFAIERNALPPSIKRPPSPISQKPSASSQAIAWKLKPS